MLTAANETTPNRMPPTAVRKDSSTVDSNMCRAASFWKTGALILLFFSRSVYPLFNVFTWIPWVSELATNSNEWSYPFSEQWCLTSLRKSASTLWLLSMTRMTSQPAVVWVMGVWPLMAPAMNKQNSRSTAALEMLITVVQHLLPNSHRYNSQYNVCPLIEHGSNNTIRLHHWPMIFTHLTMHVTMRLKHFYIRKNYEIFTRCCFVRGQDKCWRYYLSSGWSRRASDCLNKHLVTLLKLCKYMWFGWLRASGIN